MSSLPPKYHRMLECGVPLEAVVQRAQLEGHSHVHAVSLDGDNEDKKTLFVSAVAAPSSKHHRSSTTNKFALKAQANNLKKKRKLFALMEQNPNLPRAALELRAQAEGIALQDLLPVTTNKRPLPASAVVEKEAVVWTKNGEKDIVKVQANSELALWLEKLGLVPEHSSQDIVLDAPAMLRSFGTLQSIQRAISQNNRAMDATDLPVSHRQALRQTFLDWAHHLYGKASTRSSPTGRVQIAGLDSLIEHIQAKFAKHIQEIQKDAVAFTDLGLIYPPGSLVSAQAVVGLGSNRDHLICQVAWNRYRPTARPNEYVFEVALEFVAGMDQDTACVIPVVETIRSFEGRQSVRNQLLWPLDKNEGFIQAYASQRGVKWNRLWTKADQVPYLAHSANAFTSIATGKSSPAPGRVLIDIEGGYAQGHSLRFGHDSFVRAIQYKVKEYHLSKKKKNYNKENRDDSSSLVLFSTTEGGIPAEWLHLVWPNMVAFGMKDKVWGEVSLDCINEIVFEPDLWNKSLVIPSKTKRLVQALVETHQKDQDETNFVSKGNGLVLLLYGPPGVGKTLTAEALAERLESPIYIVTLAEVWGSPAVLEKQLGRILTMCARWKALVVLDEADLFLQPRNVQSMEQSAMVCVLLRLLEYFDGVFFLTSNRNLDDLDEAVVSRLSLAVKYSQLSLANRTQLWEQALGQTCNAHALAAAAPLNGREIHNVVRLSKAVAQHEGMDLNHALVMDTLKVYVASNPPKGWGWKRFFSK